MLRSIQYYSLHFTTVIGESDNDQAGSFNTNVSNLLKPSSLPLTASSTQSGLVLTQRHENRSMVEDVDFRGDETDLSTVDNNSEMNRQSDFSQKSEIRSNEQNEGEHLDEEQKDIEQSQLDEPDDSRSDGLRKSCQKLIVDVNTESGMEIEITSAELHDVGPKSYIANVNGHASQIPSLTSSQGSCSPSPSNTPGE